MKVSRPQSKQPIPPSAKKVFDGIIFDIYQWEQKMYDGSIATFEKARRKADSVGVLPVTSEGKIILTKQEQPQEEPFIGSIGGRMDKGEEPIDTAKRELMEESGYKAKEFVLLQAIQPEIKVDWATYTFIAKGLEKIADMSLDAGEKIELVEYSFDEFLDLVTQDNFRDSELALFLLKTKASPQELTEIRKMFINE